MSTETPVTSTVDSSQLAFLAEIIENVAGVPAADVQPEKSLVEDLGLDSLAIVAVVFGVEDSTGGDIPDEALTNVRTVRELLDLINQHTTSG